MLTNLKEGTQLMSIYTPYFYIIQDVRNGMYYAGAKWAKDANPDNFMVEGGYTTSSKIINAAIENHGIEVFTIRKLRSFTTREDAILYETKFLQKVNAKRNKRFYNGHNNERTLISSDSEFMKLLFLEKYGVEHYTQSDEYRKRYHKTCMDKYGVPFHTQSEQTKEAQKKTNLLRRGVENPSHCPKVRNKISSATRKTKGTDEWKSTQGKALSIRSKDRFTGKTIITDGYRNKWFDPIEDTLPTGWRLGRAEQIKQKGRICITDGKVSRFVHPAENIPEGWYKGRRKRK
jgi:hypothetical protein